MEATGSPTGSDWINFSVNFSNNSRSGVYVFCAARGDDNIPFYVGESEKVAARLGEYARASFKAQTDFRVGRAARLLEERGYEILVEIEWIPGKKARKAREKELIKRHGDRPLMNSVGKYNYKKTASEEEVMAVLKDYVRENFSAT